MPTLKLHTPHSPTAAVASSTTSSPTMLERAVSFRRPSTLQQDDVVIFLNDHHPSTSSSITLDQGDESKTKKPNWSLLAFNCVSRASHYCFRPMLCLVLCILLVFLSVFSVLRSSSFVCVSPFDPKTRLSFFGLDGHESDFGALGVPWCRSKHGKTVEWTSKDLHKGLEEFVPIYETRPIKNSKNGMGFDHSFGLWFIARWLKPDLMIESDAFNGHSTWVLRQAMPGTPIISFSPKHPSWYLKRGSAYVDGNCTYFTEKDFVDFGSVDWKKMMKKHGITDLSRVLVFFDDHQNELRRVKEALNAGFRHLVFNDNYDTGTGDHYSLRQICDQFYIRGGGHSCFRDSDEARIRSTSEKFWKKAVDTDDLCGPNEEWWGVRGWMRDDFNNSNVRISHEEHFKNSRFIESILDVYWELPPVAGPSLTHQTWYDPARSTLPIVEDGHYRTFQKLGLSRLDNSVFNGYTQMVYIEISKQES